MKALTVVAFLILSQQRDRVGKAPDIQGPSVWGNVELRGRSLTIDGHPRWSAVGTLLPSGVIKLTWIEVDTGRCGHGRYEISGRGVSGTWGWLENTEWTEDGQLLGGRPDVIRARE